MPRKTLRRWLPDPHKIVESRAIHWMGPLFKDPNLFHINRTSIGPYLGQQPPHRRPYVSIQLQCWRFIDWTGIYTF